MRTWYHLAQGKRFGPFTMQHLRERAEGGLLKPDDEVMCETHTGGNYLEARTLPGLFGPVQVSVETVVAAAPPEPVTQHPVAMRWVIGLLALMGLGLVAGLVWYLNRPS